MNHRIAKTISADNASPATSPTTYFVYDYGNVALEFTDPDGRTGTAAPTLSTRYLFGQGADQILAQEVYSGGSSTTTWMLTDHEGSVRDLIDNTGAVRNHYVYDSFGKVISSQAGATAESRYRYTGREWENETGLYYYRARYYDPATGRFIGQDPQSFGAGDTNLYRYVENSPTNATDPSGMVSMKELLNALPLSLRQSFAKWNYPVWRPYLDEAFPGVSQHATDFMDRYFYGHGLPLDLRDIGGLLDSIRLIPKIGRTTDNFDASMRNKIRQAIKMLQEPCYTGVSAKLTLPISAIAHLDLTQENFSIGQTLFHADANVVVARNRDGRITVEGQTLYTIDDTFDDVADIKSITREKEELPGGEGYSIKGQWYTTY